MIICCGPAGAPGAPTINWMGCAYGVASRGGGENRRRIAGRVPIIAAIITAAGAVTAAVVAGAFSFVGWRC
ncbi:hypothetical protein GCM10012284_11480 [Mangrovihabitans endophyticus]|uniref:Uncharacterized protein n=1 Tax=Mangrovihabitans endophyticus TaxID=1751298 RepID=A0A8J3FMV7_9ACTN|nr:hypothetical protein GCM10012284_11480 [Mangrovihabitans endophyticus]